MDSGGAVVAVPLHRHEVSLDFWRVEAELRYQWTADWALWLRVPYEIKDRTASTRLLEPATPLQQQQIDRGLEIHHPDETLHGISDLQLLAVRRFDGIWAEGDRLSVGLGFTIPTGKTEEDPFVLGDAGLPHEHLQFGNGSVDPLLESYYARPLSGDVAWVASLNARLPFYQTQKGYRGAPDATAALGLRWRVQEPLELHAFASYYYQDYAHWRGRRDINSGVQSLGVSLGGRYALGDGLSLQVDVRLPVSQETLSSSGDGFEQGPLYMLGLSYDF